MIFRVRIFFALTCNEFGALKVGLQLAAQVSALQEASGLDHDSVSLFSPSLS